MLFQSTVPATMKKLFAEVQSQATTQRKNDAIKRIDYYRSEQDQYTFEQIAQWAAEPEKLTPMQLNIVRKIINTLAMVYIEPARRTVEGSEKDVQLFTDIGKAAMLDSVMKQAQRYTKLLKTVLLRPVLRNSAMEIDILTPDILDVTTGDSPRDLQKVMVTNWPQSGKAEDVTYSLWDADTFQRLDWRGNAIEAMPNPYRCLPFVPCWDSLPIDDFWVKGGGDIITAQSAINEKLTDLLYIIRQQGFGVGWIKSGDHGPTGMGAVDTVKASPGSFVVLPTDGNAGLGFAAPNAPIAETWETIQGIAQQTAVANGLSAHSLTAKPVNESGISKIVSNQELMEKRRDDIELWRRCEGQLFDLIKTIWNTHNATKFSGKAQLRVDFADLRDPDQEIDDSNKWQGLIDAGQASPVDWAISRNPDLTREQAIEYLRLVRKEALQLSEEETKAPVFDFDN